MAKGAKDKRHISICNFFAQLTWLEQYQNKAIITIQQN